MNTYHLYKSDKPQKKYYVITPTNKKIYFGQKGASDYLDHKSDLRKDRYILRHKKNENWNDLKTAGFWSRYLLWEKPNMKSAISNIQKIANIKIISHL